MTSAPPRRGRVDLIAPPFSGHLHPILGIGRRLARDGLDVRVISTESAAARIRDTGLQPHCLLAGKDADIHAIAEPPRAVRGNPLRLNAQLRANLALLGQFQRELRALYRIGPPDLAIVDFTLPIAGFAAREAGVPWWTSLPSPCVLETSDGPPAYVGGWLPRHDWFGHLRDAAGRLVVRGFKRGVVRLHRQTMNELGLPGPYREDGSEAAYSSECILALGLRELEFARQWPEAVRFVGPVRYTPPNLGEPPAFAAGRRHVLVSLGTHLRAHKDRIAAAAEAAARALPKVEFHFTDGRVPGVIAGPTAGAIAGVIAGAGGGAVADVTTGAITGAVTGTRLAQSDRMRGGLANFQRLPFIDYGLLPRYDLVVHHAGAGILNETIAAGLPAIVVPIDYDQFDNAARLRAAGLAVGPRSLADLPRAIERALADADTDDGDDDGDGDGAKAKAIRQRYRELVLSQPGEERISALVREHLGLDRTSA